MNALVDSRNTQVQRSAVGEYQTEEPLFPHAYAALRFAFAFSTQASPEPTPHAKLMRGPGGNDKGLAGLDGAAQAGMIRAAVASLSPVQARIITARFALDDHERLEAMLALIPHAAAQLGTGMNSRRLVDALVQKFFGVRKVYIKDLAEQFGVHHNTLTPKWASIRARFETDEERAMDEVEFRLRRSGVIG